ncbi:MAG TPA: hypothetical protein VGH13_22455 [Xanthobacteraceae bacterium]|jgi:hypothetical protein
MNLVDVLFFQAEIAPDKLALVAHGSVVPYRKLVYGILSAEQRLAAIGVTAGQTVAISVAHPIDHLAFACALYRLKAASASIAHATDAYLDHVPFDLVLSDGFLPAFSVKQPSAKFHLVDPSWFLDQVAFDVSQRASSRRDSSPDWTARVTCYPESGHQPIVVKTTSRVLEEQLMSYCISAPPSWDRMISVAGIHTSTGFVQTLSALWLGRSVCLADVATARSLSTIYKHDYLVANSEEVDPLLRLQDVNFAALSGLRAACFEGRACRAATIARGLATICSNLHFRYVHPQIGIVAYGDVRRFGAVDGAVGFVAPWIEAQVVDADETPLQARREGALRFRARDRLLPQTTKAAPEDGKSDATNGWIYPGQRAWLTADNLLVVASAGIAA